jgi:hypothetical protein
VTVFGTLSRGGDCLDSVRAFARFFWSVGPGEGATPDNTEVSAVEGVLYLNLRLS